VDILRFYHLAGCEEDLPGLLRNRRESGKKTNYTSGQKAFRAAVGIHSAFVLEMELQNRL
jgi:hypothetical protein